MNFKGPDLVALEYDIDYASEFFGNRDRFALSLRYPVDLRVSEGPLPGFVLDLIPQGEPLKRVLRRYQLKDTATIEAILSLAPLAPPGNIRIKEPWQDIEQRRASYKHHGFTRSDITQRNRDFLDYMEKSGAPIGGTSGALGGSPKFLMRRDADGRYHAEGWLDDNDTLDAYLVKLPYTDSENSRLLSRVEKTYYDILRELPVSTGAAIEIEDDTLFIKRFDRVRDQSGRLLYHGLESLYSAQGINVHAAHLRHEDNIQLIAEYSSAKAEDILEYLSRDILNQMLANTDNHGRNTSIIKTETETRLSPIYDVTAMQFFNGDFITELTRWDAERATLAARLAWVTSTTQIDRNFLQGRLLKLAQHTQHIGSMMAERGVPHDIIERSRLQRERMQHALEALT